MGGLDIRMREVGCRHGRVEAVADVDLEIAAGERVALTGTNGSGKTTLLRAVLGLHRHVTGMIQVGGRGTGSAAEWARRRRACAWIPQKPAAGRFPLLGDELLSSSGGAAPAAEAADRLGVGPLTGRPLHTLSGGQLQRMYLARAIGSVAAGAGVLLADEPTAALDFQRAGGSSGRTDLPARDARRGDARPGARGAVRPCAGDGRRPAAGGPVTLATADLGELLQLVPVQRAGIALLLAAIGLPVIGVVIVGLDIMPVPFAMMHVALLGIAVGLLTGRPAHSQASGRGRRAGTAAASRRPWRW